jgi:hypothetical protein
VSSIAMPVLGVGRGNFEQRCLAIEVDGAKRHASGVAVGPARRFGGNEAARVGQPPERNGLIRSELVELFALAGRDLDDTDVSCRARRWIRYAIQR